MSSDEKLLVRFSCHTTAVSLQERPRDKFYMPQTHDNWHFTRLFKSVSPQTGVQTTVHIDRSERSHSRAQGPRVLFVLFCFFLYKKEQSKGTTFSALAERI